MIEYRLSKPQDQGALREIWLACFPGDEVYADWFFCNRYKADNALVASEGGRLMAALHLVDYEIMLRTHAVKSYCITGVATHPQFRNRGLAGKLMQLAIQTARQRDIGFAFLYPQIGYAYYRKFGFEVFCNNLLVQSSPEMWIGDTADIQCAKSCDVQALKTLYERYMARYDAHSVRTCAAWQQRLGEIGASGGYAVVATRQDVPIGAMLIEDGAVVEIYGAPLAQIALLRFAGEVSVVLAQDSPLIALMDDGRGKVGLQMRSMLCITDAVLALNKLSIRCDVPLHLRIAGDVNPAVLLDDTGAHVRETSQEDACLSQNTLSRLISGAIGVEDAREMGLITMGDAQAEELNRVLFKGNPFLYELC